VTALFGLAMVAVIAWLAVAARRAAEGQSARRDLVLAALASTVAFACLGKVLSPQYLVWVAPLTALALAWRMHGLAAVCAAATALTLVEFPDHYREVVHRVPWVLGLVTVRDVLLLAAVGLALRELGVRSPRARAPAPTRSRWRGRRLRPRPAPR
jgi:MFS family permease